MLLRQLLFVLLFLNLTFAFGAEPNATPNPSFSSVERAMKDRLEKAQRLPRSDDGYTWQAVAERRKLSPAQIEALGRDKMCYGDSMAQIFEPYMVGQIFITTDSLLSAYHVLYEDSYREYERRNRDELRQQLEALLLKTREALRTSPFLMGDMAASWRQVEFTLGPALLLLGSSRDVLDAEVCPEIEDQVAKIKTGHDAELPKWLAPADDPLPAIDYASFKPVGFYAEDAKLADYFRAVRWLQVVPFRVNREVELGAIALLGDALSFPFGSGNYFKQTGRMFGRCGEPALAEVTTDFQRLHTRYYGATWAETLRKLATDPTPYTIHMRPDSLSPEESRAQLSPLRLLLRYHVLSEPLLRETELFRDLALHGVDPEGLVIPAFLGSSFARSHLEHAKVDELKAALTRIVSKYPDRQFERSLYQKYLDMLSTLNAPISSEAPAFMRTPAWEAKATQTLLSSWAQARHTFTGQPHEELSAPISFITAPGFIEANPEFFAAMAELIERVRTQLDTCRERWDALARLSYRLEALTQKQLRHAPWSAADERFLKNYGETLSWIMGYAGYWHDNTPRWSVGFDDPTSKTSLIVATGRPRVIYVLYPWNGMEVLCQGAVVPYFEYRSTERLSDSEWQHRLDGADAPATPSWLQPYFGKTPAPLMRFEPSKI